MCGIVGLVQAQPAALAMIQNMANALVHRGPDSHGIWKDQEASVALGHRRLAILELSAEGHQPMVSASGRYVLVFNGEIYNHLQLRTELVNLGQHFRGHSDTEVLLAAIEQWGVAETLKRSVGMFAWGLWDRNQRTLSLARDRMGEKPLYYGWVNGSFAFASELSAFKALPGWNKDAINLSALAHYLRFNYVPDPLSIYQNIHKLEPGQYATLDHQARLEIKTYWSLLEVASQPKLEISFKEASDALEQRLTEAVSLQMMADVPVGAFLSGGIDSSTIAALMQQQASRPVKTFTIGFDQPHYNEAEFAKQVAQHLGTEHHELYVTAQDCLNLIPSLPQLFSEPLADSSQVPTYLVAKLAKNQVTVALSGDGGDEVFGGYRRYRLANMRWGIYRALPHVARQALGRLSAKSLPDASRLETKAGRAYFKGYRSAYMLQHSPTREAFYQNFMSIEPDVSLWLQHAPQDVLSWQRYAAPALSFKEWMMAADSLSSFAGGILTKVDRAAMGVSLETRAPILDHRVVEFAWQLPLDYKQHQDQGKRVLREVLYRHVPRALVDRRKMGFSVPLRQWLKGPLKEWAEHLLDPARLRAGGIWNPDVVAMHWRAHQLDIRDFSQALWGVLMFEAWREQH